MPNSEESKHLEKIVHPAKEKLDAYKEEHLDSTKVAGRGTAAGGAIPKEALEASEEARTKTPEDTAALNKDPFREDRVSALEPSYKDVTGKPAS